MAPPGKILSLHRYYSRHSAEATWREYPGASGSAWQKCSCRRRAKRLTKMRDARAGAVILTHVMRQLVHWRQLIRALQRSDRLFFFAGCSGRWRAADTHLAVTAISKKWAGQRSGNACESAKKCWRSITKWEEDRPGFDIDGVDYTTAGAAWLFIACLALGCGSV